MQIPFVSRLAILTACYLVFMVLVPPSAHAGTTPAIASIIRNSTQHDAAIKSSSEQLVILDFYADWCPPCKQLDPILTEIARKNPHTVRLYKINIDKSLSLSRLYGIRGIPSVAFIRNGETVHSLIGLHPKESYLQAIDRFAPNKGDSPEETPDGDIIGGVRVIRRSAAAALDTIHIYRGETVRLIIDGIDFPYSLNIPDFDLTAEATAGRPLEVTFKAREVGVFPVFCNGNCPAGDGLNRGQVVVMQLQGSASTRYTELTAAEARSLIDRTSPLILDVRTPREFHGGHLKTARLIPVQQLESRLNELNEFKEREILLYCRSGNRSTVAAEILMRQGFSQLYNLRSGIREWQSRGFPMVN